MARDKKLIRSGLLKRGQQGESVGFGNALCVVHNIAQHQAVAALPAAGGLVCELDKRIGLNTGLKSLA